MRMTFIREMTLIRRMTLKRMTLSRMSLRITLSKNNRWKITVYRNDRMTLIRMTFSITIH